MDWDNIIPIICIVVIALVLGVAIFMLIDHLSSSQVCTFTAEVVHKDKEFVYKAAEVWEWKYEVAFSHPEFGHQTIEVSKRKYNSAEIGKMSRFEQRAGGISKTTYFKMLLVK